MDFLKLYDETRTRVSKAVSKDKEYFDGVLDILNKFEVLEEKYTQSQDHLEAILTFYAEAIKNVE